MCRALQTTQGIYSQTQGRSWEQHCPGHVLGRSGGHRGHTIGEDQHSRKQVDTLPGWPGSSCRGFWVTLLRTRKPWRKKPLWLSGWEGSGARVAGCRGQSSQTQDPSLRPQEHHHLLALPLPRVQLDPDKHLTPSLFS